MLVHRQVNGTCICSQGGRAGGGTRREAGNSDFVRRALLPVMPDREEFGFTVRLNADALALDGSTAAASVCRCKAAKHCRAVPVASGRGVRATRHPDELCLRQYSRSGHVGQLGRSCRVTSRLLSAVGRWH